MSGVSEMGGSRGAPAGDDLTLSVLRDVTGSMVVGSVVTFLALKK